MSEQGRVIPFAGGEAEVGRGTNDWPVEVAFTDGVSYPEEVITASFRREDAVALAEAILTAAAVQAPASAYVRDEDGNVAWHAISEEGDLCPVCNHPADTHSGPVYDGCTWVNGYGHMEGDHLCGCPLTPRINLHADHPEVTS